MFPALSRLEIAEALGMAGGDLHLAAEALLSATQV